MPIRGEVERLGRQAEKASRARELLEDVGERLEAARAACIVQRRQSLLEQAQEHPLENTIPGTSKSGSRRKESEAGRRLARFRQQVVAVLEQRRWHARGLARDGGAGQEPIGSEDVRLPLFDRGESVLGIRPRRPEDDTIAGGAEGADGRSRIEVAEEIAVPRP